MKFKAQWSQIPKTVEVCEATIEAEDGDEALEKFLKKEFESFLVTSRTEVEETDVDYGSVKWLKK